MQTRISVGPGLVDIPRLLEFISGGGSSSCQVPNAQLLHIFKGDLSVVVDVESLEERVDVFLLGVVGRVKDSVGVGEDGHGLSERRGTFTGSIAPVRSLS